MVDRRMFIWRVVGAFVVLPVVGLKNPFKQPWTSQYIRDPDADYREPWPNDQAFPCIQRSLWRPGRGPDCWTCRAKHNRIIVKWEPERWKNLIVDDATGRCHWVRIQ